MRAEQVLLALVCQPGTNDSNQVFISFRVYDDYNPTLDRANGDETVLTIRVLRVEYLQVVNTRLEELLCLRKGHAMFGLVTSILVFVPFESHRTNSKPMTY